MQKEKKAYMSIGYNYGMPDLEINCSITAFNDGRMASPKGKCKKAGT
jgi:hypothetical protein